MWEMASVALDIVLAILLLIAVIMAFKEKEPAEVLLKTCGAEALMALIFVFCILGGKSWPGAIIYYFEILVIQILLTIRMFALKSKEKPVIKIAGMVITIGGMLFLLV